MAIAGRNVSMLFETGMNAVLDRFESYEEKKRGLPPHKHRVRQAVHDRKRFHSKLMM